MVTKPKPPARREQVIRVIHEIPAMSDYVDYLKERDANKLAELGKQVDDLNKILSGDEADLIAAKEKYGRKS